MSDTRLREQILDVTRHIRTSLDIHANYREAEHKFHRVEQKRQCMRHGSIYKEEDELFGDQWNVFVDWYSCN